MIGSTDSNDINAITRKREQRYREFFENAEDVIYVHDLNGHYTSVNKAGARLVGYSCEEILQMRVSDFVAPEDMDEIRKRINQKLRNPEQTTYEVDVINRRGQRIPVEVNSWLTFEDGRPVAVQGIARDITKRKRMERERQALFEITQGVSTCPNVEELLKLIHKSLRKVLYAENCFVALCDESKGTLNMQFFVDKYDSTPPPRKIGKSCAAYVFRAGESLLINQEILSQLVKAGEVELIGRPSPSWLGVPLKTPLRTIGVLVVQHYENADAYSERDVEFLASVGSQMAIAIERKTAEERLQDSERRLRLATESSNTGLWDWDLQTNLTWYSPQWKRQIGYEDPEISDGFEEWLSRIHPDDLSQATTRVKTYLEGRLPRYESEFRIRHKDGSYRWVLAQGSLITDHQGVPLRMLGSHVDITERKKAEEALRESEERYRQLFEGSVMGTSITSISGEVVNCNAAFARILGFKSVADVLKTNAGFLYRNSAVRKALIDSLRRERVLENHELELKRVDGATIFVSANITGVFDDLGELTGLHSHVIDITERKRAEAELARLVAAVEQTADSIVITDTSGNIQYVNPAFERITGYSEAEVLGQNPRILKSGKIDPSVYEDLWEAITRGEIWVGQLTNRRKDGTLFEEHVTISPVRDNSGRVANYIAVKQDISSQTQLEAQLRQSQKLEAIGQLAGGVAHDFNNMLTAILGYSDLSLARLKADDPVARNIREVKKAAERAAGLTRQLLAFSRKQILEPRILDLNYVVGDINKMLRRLIGEDIDLTTTLASDLGRIKADPTQIEQVLMNLAVNARDAMPRGGRLTIETQNVELNEEYAAKHQPTRAGEYVLLAVSDTGCGIDAETQAHIFEPFFTTKGIGKGTGLGLSTIYGIVKQSGGFIWVYSELDVGTTFKIYLPRLKDAADVEPPSISQPVVAAATGTVLLVEDDAEVRGLVARSLESSGYKVIESGNSTRALAIAHSYEERIDLLITDVVMPVMGGRELAERLAILRPGTRVLFISGYTDDAIVRHGIMDRDIAFLQKPFTPDSLLRKVAEVLQA